ncbi:hypothetical protein E3P81_03346 [Wallemia ichthyophaga]|nr:hypothetical protein E3P97_03383 [Wallemia ichthyophaga]TIB29349.1 hypothetical protein E3P85_03208 [Wallemia ichthyophaga]TIB44784.1 hypothetical protein E3P82_03351 [Wallemia ichthyophaga]TIB47214.1 hypothetical protein E3P81_03346 [Wallemia ichthyophaga]TIB50184.1 hypothetical protein E3P80_03355 [Wallemia ichthyophaga]
MDRIQFIRLLSNPEYLTSIHPAISNAITLNVIDSHTKLIRVFISSGWTKSIKYSDIIITIFYNQHSVISVATSIDPQSEEPYQYAQIPLLAWSAEFNRHSTKINHYWQWNIKNHSNTGSIMSNLVDLMANSSDIPLLNSFDHLNINNYSIDNQRDCLSFQVNVENHSDSSPHLSLVVLADFAWDLLTSSDCNAQISNHSSLLLIQIHFTHSTSLSIEKTTGPPSSVRFNGIIKPISISNDPILNEALPKSSAHKFHANSIMNQLSNSSKQEESALTEHSSQSTSNSSLRSSSRTPSQATEIASIIRHNYTYFSSLLQEPEPKWKHVSDTKGVSITQLDTIDPAVVLYRGQATFIGVNIFDIFAVFESYGSRVFWDKTFEDATLLEDINNASFLWYLKTKPVWPANARDNVLVTTSYKSMASIHCFGFTAHDSSLFPTIPPIKPNLIRSQTDLSGVAIESLSPTTVQVTVLEQSDPKGWQNKSGIPQILTQQISGVGEFAIKYGGPPILTDITNARTLMSHYDHEKANYKLEYEMILPFDTLVPVQSEEELHPNRSKEPFTITCLLRCDLDRWANSIDIIIDPPATNVECIKRHRLSARGGGLWIAIKHQIDPSNEQYDIMDSKLAVNILRSKKDKDRGSVYVNGMKETINNEEMSEESIAKLKAMKRHPPACVPLDTLAERHLEVNDIDPVEGWLDLEKKVDVKLSSSSSSVPASASNSTSASTSVAPMNIPNSASADKEVASRYTSKMGSIPEAPSIKEDSSILSQNFNQDATKHKEPMRRALDSLSWTRRIHEDLNTNTHTTSSALKNTLTSQKQQLYGSSVSTSGSIASNNSNTDLLSTDGSKNTNWNVIFEKDDLTIKRKIFHALSNDVPVQVGQRVFEGWSVNEVASAIHSSYISKSFKDGKNWDNERIAHNDVLEVYASGSFSSHLTLKTTFPFKDRAFFTSTITSNINGKCYITSASIDPSLLSSHNFNGESLNSGKLPYGRVLIDSWVLEEIDPYSTEKLLIPSTTVNHYVAVDYRGNVPSTVNNLCNTLSVKVLNNLDQFLKNNGPPLSVLKPTQRFTLNKNSEIPDEVSLKEGELSWVIDGQNKGEGGFVASNTYDGEHHLQFGHALLSEEEIAAQAGVHELEEKDDPLDDIDIDQVSSALPERLVEQQQQQNSNSHTNSQAQSRIVTPSNLAKRASSMSLRVSPGLGQVKGMSGSSTATLRRSDYKNNDDNLLQALRFGKDYILAEMVIDLQLYSGGVNMNFESVVSNERLPLSLQHDNRDTRDDAAVAVNMHNLTSALDPARVRHKQLLRLVLRCGSLDDGVRLNLLNHHKLITTLTLGCSDGLTPEKEFLCNGNTTAVQTEKLSMQDLLDGVKCDMLDCVSLSNSNGDTAVPPGLLNPLSVSRRHIRGAEQEGQAEQSELSEAKAGVGASEAREVVDGDTSEGEIVQSNSLMSIFGTNSNVFSTWAPPSFPSLQSLFNISTSKTATPEKKEDEKTDIAEEARSASSSPSPETYQTPEGVQSPAAPESLSPPAHTLQAAGAGHGAVDVVSATAHGTRHNYTLKSLGLVFLLTAITFFLLGCLLRSLTLPDDYVVYVHNNVVNFDRLANLINYKVFTKLLQLKIPFMNTNVIIGLA